MKKKTLAALKKLLDGHYSKYIRLKAADENGIVTCFTCGKIDHYKKMQCCHYISRRFLPTRFYEKNTHPGCPYCNMYLNGNLDEYALKLIEKYGDGILEELNGMKHRLIKLTVQDYEDLIGEYKEKVKQLETSANG